MYVLLTANSSTKKIANTIQLPQKKDLVSHSSTWTSKGMRRRDMSCREEWVSPSPMRAVSSRQSQNSSFNPRQSIRSPIRAAHENEQQQGSHPAGSNHGSNHGSTSSNSNHGSNNSAIDHSLIANRFLEERDYQNRNRNNHLSRGDDSNLQNGFDNFEYVPSGEQFYPEQQGFGHQQQYPGHADSPSGYIDYNRNYNSNKNQYHREESRDRSGFSGNNAENSNIVRGRVRSRSAQPAGRSSNNSSSLSRPPQQRSASMERAQMQLLYGDLDDISELKKKWMKSLRR